MNAVIAALILFGIIILVHELGHFVVAKLAGIKVHEFSIGIGPSIWSKKRKDTLYSLRLFPIGGYNLIEGEDDHADTPGSFSSKPAYIRFLVLISGSMCNIFLGYIVLVILTFMNGYVGTTTVAAFGADSVSAQSIRLGDEIIKVNGRTVRTSNDITYEFLRDADGYIILTVGRDDAVYDMPIQFNMQIIDENTSVIDIDFKVAAIRASGIDYVTYPVNWSLSIVKQVWGSLIDLLKGRYTIHQLSGPVGVVSAIGYASTMGIERLLQMCAFIAINIGIFNLLPIPVLDGGKIVLLVFEKISGRVLPQRVVEAMMLTSMLLLIGLIVFTTYNDVFRAFNL